MTTFYSKSTKGFYPLDIFGPDERPVDCVEITREYHAELLKAESEGKMISADENGYPVAVDKPEMTTERLAFIVRKRRDLELSWFDSSCYRNQFYWESLTQEQRDERLAYRQALLDVPEQEGFPHTVVWPDFPTL